MDGGTLRQASINTGSHLANGDSFFCDLALDCDLGVS